MTTLRTSATAGSIPGDEGLRRSILRRIAPILHACGVGEHEVTCALSGDVRSLVVEIDGPGVLQSVERALGVRVLDAVHAHGSTFGRVTVAIVD